MSIQEIRPEDGIKDCAAKVAYRAWREAQRGGLISDAEHEAMWSRVEAGWMAEVIDALDVAGLLAGGAA